MCFPKQAAINSVGMGGRDDGYLMPGLADPRRWLFILKGKICLLFWCWFLLMVGICHHHLLNLTTLRLQQGSTNLVEEVSLKNKNRSWYFFLHLQYLPGEYTTLTTLDTASYPSYQLTSSPTRFQADPSFSISSPSFYTGTPTITQVANCNLQSLFVSPQGVSF